MLGNSANYEASPNKLRYEGNSASFGLVYEGARCVSVDMAGSPEEQASLKSALEAGFEQLNTFFEGNFTQLFKGLEIQVDDGLTKGGGQAFGRENRIVFDRQKMLMPLAKADAYLAQQGYMDSGDRLRAVPPEFHDKPCIAYEVVHEIGHILQERSGVSLPDGLAALSPSNLYNRDPTKPHEAFAEGFAYMVFGHPVAPELAAVVQDAIGAYEARRLS